VKVTSTSVLAALPVPVIVGPFFGTILTMIGNVAPRVECCTEIQISD